VFSLTAAATVDEGNNWVNMAYGPLSLYSPANQTGTGAPLGNYSIVQGPAVNVGSATGAPDHDFFGTSRPQGGAFDIGAVELVGGTGGGTAAVSVTPTSLAFGNVRTTTTSGSQNLTLSNTGTAAFTLPTLTFSSGSYSRNNGGGFPATAPNCGATLLAGASCTIKVRFSPTAPGLLSATLTITGVTGSPVALSGTGVAGLAGSPNPLTITLAAGVPSGSGTVTLTNPAGGQNATVSAVTVPLGGTLLTWTFMKGTDNCTGHTLAPGQTCTVGVVFNNVNLAPGTHTVTMTFTTTGINNPTVVLRGTAN
jgi:hypothetical protein